ncbi:MAG: DNA/RNA nuclease SfsA [Chloroflexi bacterium]|nr:DNA/RNA nuclease SfsA [Chloroflexota bacterium]
MKLSPDLVEATFIRRLNRFAANLEVDGREVMAHLANSGRLGELLVPGYRMLLTPVAGDHRKCPFDLALVDLGFTLCSADARLPNVLLAEAIEAGRVAEFQGYSRVRREVTYGDSRLDMLLEGPGQSCFVETKSVTLVEDGLALFPDAPTLRGVKHLNSLIHAKEEGYRAAVVFVIQRSDAKEFSPHDVADPLLGETLRKAVGAGVEAFAYCCTVTRQEILLANRIPIKL